MIQITISKTNVLILYDIIHNRKSTKLNFIPSYKQSSNLFHPIHPYALNTDKEALLPLPRHHQTPLQYRILTTNSNPFRCSGTPQFQNIITSPFLSRSCQGVANGEEYCTSHKQWRFSYTTRSLYCSEVFPFDVFEEGDVEFLGDVAEPGDFVGAGTTCEELAGKENSLVWERDGGRWEGLEVETYPLARCQRLSSVVKSPWPCT